MARRHEDSADKRLKAFISSDDGATSLFRSLRNFNPKLIRLTLGNTSNAATLNALRSAAPEIIAAFNSANRGMVEPG